MVEFWDDKLKSVVALPDDMEFPRLHGASCSTSRLITMQVAFNRKASFLYTIESQSWEAGVVLLGSEVKALRLHRPSIADAYVAVTKGLQPFIYNLQIPKIDSVRYPGRL